MEIYFQILINSVVTGLLLSLIAVGFTYIFEVTKVFHLAHAGIYAVGGFSFLWMYNTIGLALPSILFALILVSLLVLIIEKTVYLPISRSKSNQAISLIASMGIYIILVNFLAMLFGNENQILPNSLSGTFTVGSIIVTKVQLLQLVVSIIALCSALVYLKRRNTELIFRAIADHNILSQVLSINVEKERLKVLVFGSLLAAISSILYVYDVGIEPHAGMNITLTAAVITILVGRLNLTWIVVFSILLALLQNLIEWFLDAQWKMGLTFLLLLVVILFKTEGIISYNLRKDKV